jgi:hypothetical protein
MLKKINHACDIIQPAIYIQGKTYGFGVFFFTNGNCLLIDGNVEI